jgi:hypothetical protein
MNRRPQVFVLLISLGLLILTTSAVFAASPQYLGETTWTVTRTQGASGPKNPPEISTFKGGITRVGGAYYTVEGYIEQSPDGTRFSGGGVLIGNLLYLTLSASRQPVSTDREIGVVHLELDKDTLNGTFYQVSRSFDTATAGANPIFSDHYAAGTVTRTGQPINLTP